MDENASLGLSTYPLYIQHSYKGPFLVPQRMMNQASWFQEISCFGECITRHIIPDYSPNLNISLWLWIGLVDRRSLATTNKNIRMSHWPKGIKVVDWWTAGPQKGDAAALCWMGMRYAVTGMCRDPVPWVRRSFSPERINSSEEMVKIC